MLKNTVLSLLFLLSSTQSQAVVVIAPQCFKDCLIFDASETQLMLNPKKRELTHKSIQERLIPRLKAEYERVGMDAAWIKEITEEISTSFNNCEKIYMCIGERTLPLILASPLALL